MDVPIKVVADRVAAVAVPAFEHRPVERYILRVPPHVRLQPGLIAEADTA